MGAGGGAALAGLGGFSSGIASGLELGGKMQERKQQQQLRQLQMQGVQQQQQSAQIAYGGLSGLGGVGGGGIPQMSPQSPQVPMMSPQSPQVPQMSPQSPQVPNATGQMNAPLAVAQEAMRRGYPPAGAAGIAGGMTGESGRNLDPYALNPQSGAFGMAQWLGPRKEALLQRPDPYSRETQTAHLFDELRGPEAKTGQALMRETDPARAADTFTTGFERPGNVDMTGRRNVAVETYAKLTGGQGALQSPDEVIPAVKLARSTEWGVPPAAAGQLDLPAMMRAIEKRAPAGTPDEVKMGALEMMQKYLQPQQKMAFDQAKELYQQKWEGFKFGQQELDKAETRDYRRQSLDLQRQGMERGAKQGYQILTDPQSQQQFMMIPGRPETAQTLAGEPYKPQGASKLSADKGAAPSASSVDFLANIMRAGGDIPPGLARTATGSRLVQAAMDKIAAEGGQAAGDYVANKATVRSDSAALQNMTKMTAAATSFEETASKNFDLALKLSKDAIPTDFGPLFNRWIETSQTTFGDLNVPPYAAAMMTAANEYAKIMSGSTGATGSTVDSRREAAQLFSPYLSAGQIDRVVAVAKADMKNRNAALYESLDTITNRLRAAGSKDPSATKGQASQEQTRGADYAGPDDVYKAFDAGKITKEQAKQILIDKFGAK